MFHFNFKSARGADYKKYGTYILQKNTYHLLGCNGFVCSYITLTHTLTKFKSTDLLLHLTKSGCLFLGYTRRVRDGRVEVSIYHMRIKI